MIPLLLVALSFNACSSDDDEIINIDSYLKGKWYSYKAVVSAQDKSVDIAVTKTGQYSQFYYEMLFRDDNKVDFSFYKVDNYVSSWETETDSYSINGDVVRIYDDNEAIDFFYNPKEKTMYMRVAGEVEYVGYTTIFLYFRK